MTLSTNKNNINYPSTPELIKLLEDLIDALPMRLLINRIEQKPGGRGTEELNAKLLIVLENPHQRSQLINEIKSLPTDLQTEKVDKLLTFLLSLMRDPQVLKGIDATQLAPQFP